MAVWRAVTLAGRRSAGLGGRHVLAQRAAPQQLLGRRWLGGGGGDGDEAAAASARAAEAAQRQARAAAEAVERFKAERAEAARAGHREKPPPAPPQPKLTLVEHQLSKDLLPEEGAQGLFAVVRLGGTQYKVAAGDRIITAKLDAAVGKELVVDDVLLVGSQRKTYIGRPTVEGASVRAIVEEQTKDEKVLALKKRRKNHKSKRLKGHRRKLTFLYIDRIDYTEPTAATAAAPGSD